MIWSKLKKRIKDLLSDKVRDEIDFYMTDYAGGFSNSRAWITINGQEVVNFSTDNSYVNFGAPWNELTKNETWATHGKVEDDERTQGLLMEKGEFSRGDFTDSCYSYLSLSIEEAQKSEHPIIRLLAAIDRRTGKRKLLDLLEKESNPMVKYFLQYRIVKEKVNIL